MKHYGDISKLNGGNLPPVDIITFGSPCTDLSAAGKRQGLHAERSGLFFQAIRIIKEMRCATHGKYPRFIVFENVPGLFSSNSGEDFGQSLHPSAKLKMQVYLFLNLQNGQKLERSWQTISVSPGAPSMRNTGESPNEENASTLSQILMANVPEKYSLSPRGVSGYSAEGFRAWQKAARCFADCAGTTGGTGLMFENHSQDTRYTSPLEVAQTVSATMALAETISPLW